MATTPNAHLTKLAIGIASVAALAGITGRFAVGAPSSKNQPAADVQDPAAAQAAPANVQPWEGVGIWPGNEGSRESSGAFWGEGDDDEEYEHEEHEGREHGGFFFGQPSTAQPGQSQGTLQQRPRTRTRHS